MNNGRWTVVFLAVIVILTTAFTNLWYGYSDKAEDFFTNVIEPITDETELPLIVTIFVVAFVILIAAAIYNHKKSQLEGDIQDLSEKLDSEMQILVSANRELNNYRFQSNLESIFRKFISRNSFVHAVQFYRFEEKNRGKDTILTLNFITGSAYNEVNINAIHQMVFPIRKNDLRKFRDAIKESEEDESVEPLSTFAITAFRELQQTDTLTDEETGLYVLMDLALEAFEAKVGFDLTAPFSREQKERLEKLRNFRRTGLMRAGILRESFYSFTHEGSNDKANRQYLASLAIIGGEPHLFSIAMDSSILDDNYEEDLQTVKEEFTLLLNDLENGYNT